MNVLMRKIVGTVFMFAMIICLDSSPCIASTSFQLEQLESVTRLERMDYASIVERLDLDELFFFIQQEKLNDPTISEDELERKLKVKVLKYGLESEIISVDSEGMVTFNNEYSTYSYSDLPMIKNLLGKNEKRVFNKSLVKGLSVLFAAKTAMSSYKSYYDSTSGWTDDNADAFRHAVWMMISAFRAGSSYAREFGIAHENDSRDNSPLADLARTMDLTNNEIGIRMAEMLPGNFPTEEIEFMACLYVNEAVKNGQLTRFKGADIGTKFYLVPTNSVGARR